MQAIAEKKPTTIRYGLWLLRRNNRPASEIYQGTELMESNGIPAWDDLEHNNQKGQIVKLRFPINDHI